MLIFGSSVGDWQEKANYAEDKADNDFAKVHEVRCEGIEDVQTAFAAMAAFAADTKCKQFLYHATINLNPGERLTREQWQQAVDRLEEGLGLTGHHRVVFEHIKKDRQHYHIVWSRLPPEGGPAVSMSYDYFVHQRTGKELEKDFGLQPAPRKQEGQPSRKKQEINDRNSAVRIKPEQVAKDATRIYRASDTPQAFMKNLKKEGYVLSRGKNGSYVLVDKQGGYHGLLRRLEGVKLADFEKKYPELQKANLPKLNDVLRTHRGNAKSGFKGAAKIAKRPRTKASGAKTRQRHAKTRSSGSLPRKWYIGQSLASTKTYRPSGGRKYYPPPVMRRKHATATTKATKTTSKTTRTSSTTTGDNTKAQRLLTQPVQKHSSIRGSGMVSGGGSHSSHSHGHYHASHSGIGGAFSLLKHFLFGKKYRPEKEPKQQAFMPSRPSAPSGMSLAQWYDLLAAMEGKMSWEEYFQKWGGGSPSP